MSDVWKHFQKIRNDDNIVTSINCQLCETEYGTTTFTTTLCCYLNSVHSSIYISDKKEQDESPPYTPDEQKHITIKLAQWIAVDLQPFCVVEQEEF